MAISLVQSKSGTATSGTTVTVTLTSATTAGNCLIVAVGASQGTTNPTVSGITLGGSAGNFAVAKAINNNADTDCEIWADPGCAGGQTSVVVTFNAGTGSSEALAVWVMEWSGVAASSPVDKTNGAVGTGATFSSGSTGTLTQASELVVGAVMADATGAQTITGPTSPWTNLAQLTPSADIGMLASYQVVSATTAQTYSGSMVSGSVYGTVIVTLKAAAASTTAPFHAPDTGKGRPAIARGSSRSVPGAPYVFFPSHFTLPGRPSKGAPATARGKSEAITGKYVHIIPPGPAPFYLPGHPAKGGAPPARGRSASTPGAPYVFFPSPFYLPGHPSKGVPLLRRGGSTSTPGAPFVLVRTSPFFAPDTGKGRPLLRRGKSASSPGARFVLVRISPFYLPHGPAKGRSLLRRGGSTAGSATGQGAPPVPRQLIISLASMAGVDDYGNEFPQGVQVGSAQVGPQVAILPGQAGSAAEVQFPISVPELETVPNVAGFGGTESAAIVISGPQLAQSGSQDWVQIELFSTGGDVPATGYFNYINTEGDAAVIASFSGSGWNFAEAVPVTVEDTLTVEGSITTPQITIESDGQITGPGGGGLFNWSTTGLYPLAQDPNSGEEWADGERAAYINTPIQLINYIYSVLVDAGIIES